MPPVQGQRFGDYEVLGPLGAGGMGRVFKVRNIISNREEAMKILLPDYQADTDLAARFMAEIRTLATLDHPGIAQLRTAFQIENQLVMVMEYVEGTTLENLAAQTRVPLKYAMDFASQVLAALGYAHSRGVTHRDIKPANIMITTHGVVKLMDFGIAKSTTDMQLTRPGMTMGSVYYMSPEQVLGNAVDARSDLYSLGVTLYELLSGRKPFQSDSSYTVLNAQLNQVPASLLEVSPELPVELNAIVMRAMAKRPEERFQTAEEFRTALQRVRDAMSGAAATQAELGQAVSPMAAAVPDAGAEPVSVSNPTVFRPAAMQGGTAPRQDAAPGVPAVAPEVPAVATGQANVAPGATVASGQSAVGAGEPAFTPVTNVAGPARVQRSHRGLWIGVGVAAALLALAAVGVVGPRVFSTHAGQGEKSAAARVQPTESATVAAAPAAAPVPAQTEAQAQMANEPVAAQPPVLPAASPQEAHGLRPATRPVARASGAVEARPAYTSPAGAGAMPATGRAAVPAAGAAAGAAAVANGPSEQQLRQARDRLGNLQARADSAMANVQQMRTQQQAQGLDMRGDIVAAMNRLQNDMREAQRALDRRDMAAADEYSGRAENETSKLEAFLGR